MVVCNVEEEGNKPKERREKELNIVPLHVFIIGVHG